MPRRLRGGVPRGTALRGLFLTPGAARTKILKSGAPRQCLVPTWEVLNTRVFTDRFANSGFAKPHVRLLGFRSSGQCSSGGSASGALDCGRDIIPLQSLVPEVAVYVCVR